MDEKNNKNDKKQVLGWDEIEKLWDDIKMMARKILANQSEKYSWRPTALVTEALRRIHEKDGKWTDITWNSKAAFFKHCSMAMRSAIVDRHRLDSATKRISKASTISFDELDKFLGTYSPIAFIKDNPEIFSTFDQVVEKIAKDDKNLALIINYRFLHGMSIDEISVIIGKSRSTVQRLFSKVKNKIQHTTQETAGKLDERCGLFGSKKKA